MLFKSFLNVIISIDCIFKIENIIVILLSPHIFEADKIKQLYS